MASPNLGITEVTVGQDGKINRVNEARNNVELALTNRLAKAVTDGADTVLTATEAGEALGNMVYSFTGALTANRNVEVPDNTKLYICENNTTGGFSVTVKTNAGSGIALEPGTMKILYCDGTNVIAVTSANRSVLAFQFGNSIGGAGYSRTVNGVIGTATKGYLQCRAGDIIALSFLVEVTAGSFPTDDGTIDCEVRIDGVAVNLAAQVTTSGLGIYTDTVTQALGVDPIAVGELLQTFVSFGTFAGTSDNHIIFVEVSIPTPG